MLKVMGVWIETPGQQSRCQPVISSEVENFSKVCVSEGHTRLAQVSCPTGLPRPLHLSPGSCNVCILLLAQGSSVWVPTVGITDGVGMTETARGCMCLVLGH